MGVRNIPSVESRHVARHRANPCSVSVFKDLFNPAGVRVLDTNKAFTRVQTSSGIEFIDGLDEDSVDYTVQIYAYQVERRADYLRTEGSDEIDQYRIARSLYAHIASAALKNTAVLRFMNNSLISLLINRKRVVHIELLSSDPGKENHACFTLLGVSKQWLMLEGHHGTPYRVFRMSYLDVLDMCKRVTTTTRTGGWIAWARLAMWYVGWRNKVQSGLTEDSLV